MNSVRVVNLIFAAMMAGGLVMVQLAVVPTFHRLPDDLSLRLHLAVDRNIDRYLPPFTIVTVLAGLVASIFQGGLADGERILLIAGTVLSVDVALSSHLINRPMNQRMHGWPKDTVPPEYAGIRRRWDRAHIARTVPGVTALLCFIVAWIAY